MKRYESVDAYIDGHPEYVAELTKLREILLSSGLEETVKWGGPCYTCNGKNVIGIGAFKSYFGLWFYQGALIEDSHDVLINAQEGKTKALRQWRMQTAKDIKPRILKSYLKKAIAVAESGEEIKPNRSKPVVVPPEMKKALKANPKAGKNYAAMTKGKQREYADYISSAKRAETKQTRLVKIQPMLEQNIGLNDKYRNC